MLKRARAFTLIELLVVIAIIMLTLSFGFVSFFYYRERQELETTALKLQDFLRSAQNNAKNGNRGTESSSANASSCNYTLSSGVKTYNVKLTAWQVSYNDGTKTFSAKPVCDRVDENIKDIVGGSDMTFTLPDNIGFASDPSYYASSFVKFASVLGTTQLFKNPGDEVNQLKIIMNNGTNAYRFYLKPGGVVTTGCFCQEENCMNSVDNGEC
ncbi:MAG: prepilin-type N-terminal cleavage/methylation domain-containing protein [bacterium]|nr:prepilin-type N-terminal cleavage/methylation domain-containing protein [bacterium]